MEAMIEGCVRELYARARLSTRIPHGSVKLATALFGNDCVQYLGARSLPGRAAVSAMRSKVVIHLRRDQTPRELNHAAGRELAQWYLQGAGYEGRDADELVGRLTAALCVPRRAFDAARRDLGDDVPALSVAFRVSQSLMALRVGECLGHPTALITRNCIRTRGPLHTWPVTPAEWRALAAHPRRSGVHVQAITDARSRFALVAW